jgi:hypothetical protein
MGPDIDPRRAVPQAKRDAEITEQEWLSQAEIGSLTRALAAAEGRVAERDSEVERLIREALAVSNDRLADLGRLLRALGLSNHARAMSPAEVFDECLREIEGLRQRIPDAEADALRLHREKMDWRDRAHAAEARASKVVERVKALEEALRPFAKAGELFPPREPDGWDMVVYKPAAGPDYEIYGDHLRAAAILATTPDLGGEANDTTRDGGDNG